MKSPRTILITGANRGIGFAILQVAATRLPKELYILACRDAASGTEAIQKLRGQGIKARIEVQQLDITNDESVAAAVESVRTKFGELDVLINNAGIAIPLAPGASPPSNLRSSFNDVYNTNVTSVAYTTEYFLPLLRAAASSTANAQVINVSSTRGSLAHSTMGTLPPTKAPGYSVSKTAMNALTIEMQKGEEAVRFSAVCPGHCATKLNNFQGPKDTTEGAEVVVRLLETEVEKGQFWEIENGELKKVPW